MGSSSSVVVGYWYSMGVHLAACHGPVDEVQEFIIGERSAWSGSITDSDEIFVDNLELFGGESREGGVQGFVDICMGDQWQEVNEYLDQKIDGPVPAYRGLLTFVFKQFKWSAINPYFKNPWWRVKRLTMGWSRGVPWYPEKAGIGDRDMNPAHIIYECLTNLEWGMGYPVTTIDDSSFRAAADKLSSEGFGLSMLWGQQTSIQDFIQLVLRHIDGLLRIDLFTGMFQLTLFRNDYDIEETPVLDEDNVISLESYQRSAWGDSANEVVVKYTDRDQKEATIAVQDLASIEAQGGLVSTTREYPGIRDADLATRVALRDLNNVSIPLAKISIVVNRVAWDWDIGSVFRLNWSEYGLVGVPFRVTEINKGSLQSGRITMSAIEDVFGLPQAAYVKPAPPTWTDPIQAPKPVVHARAVEAPYWDVVRSLPASDFDYLPDGWAFGEVLAVEPSGDAINFQIAASPSNLPDSYEVLGAAEFTLSAVIAADIPMGVDRVTIPIESTENMDGLRDYEYFYIGDEAFMFGGYNEGAKTIDGLRGVLDTIPHAHSAGDRIFFGRGRGADITERAGGETVFYRALTRTGIGTLPIASAPFMELDLVGRAHKPYPPAGVHVNGSFVPTDVYGAGFYGGWSHRDRLQQTVNLVSQVVGNIGPEPGTEYALVLQKPNNAIVLSETTTGTSFALSGIDDAAHDYPQSLILRLHSTRDGENSWQSYSLPIERHGLGFQLGSELGGVKE